MAEHGDTPEMRTIFAASLDGIMLTTPEGEILAANPAACRLLGRDEADLRRIGRDGVVDKTDPRLVNALETRRRLGAFLGELTFLRYNGDPFPVEISTAVFTDDQGRLTTTVIFRDITERKRDEEAIRTSTEKFSKVFHNSPEGVSITRRSDGRYLEVNEAFGTLSGYRPDEVLGKTSLELGVWIDPGERQRFVQTLADRGEAVNLEALFRFHGGVLKTCLVSARELDIAGVPCILSSTRDITERKRSEDLLTQEKERLAVTLASMADGMVATDTEGVVVLVNPAASRLLGWPADETVGQPLVEFWRTLHEQTRTWTGDPVRSVLERGVVYEIPPHTCLVSRDGRESLIEGGVTPIRDGDRVSGAVLVFRDLTEKRRASESLQRMQRLESIGHLAGGIAHDFNNMLGGLFGFLELARENLRGDGTKVPRYLDRALASYDRARSLTRQLLTFSKGGTPVRKVIDLGPLIRTSVGFALSGSPIFCHFDLDADLWPCDCDENQLGQVIDNLVLNASQSMGDQGTLEVGARNVSDPPGHQGDFVCISVSDRGAGILAENLARIFDPFFSTKTTGHGLGLAMVFSIVRQHDGWVDVTSVPGAGATFFVYLPASPVAVDPTSSSPLDHFGQGAVLVMDDEPDILDVASELLGSMGYRVVGCRDSVGAIEAFERAHRSKTPFAAAILDLTIPGDIGGIATAQALRQVDPEAIVVASSGYSEDQVFARPTDFGFSGRIAKPFLKNDLARLLNDLLG